MYATIEPLAAVIRVHKEGEETYAWACTCVLDLHSSTARLYGAVRSPSLTEARAVKKALLEAGITEAQWERRTGKVRSTGLKATPK